MKTFLAIVILAFPLSSAVSAQNRGNDAGCKTCAQTIAVPQMEAAAAQEIAALPKGRIENLVPISVLIALGCDRCAEKAVQWAMAQGSSREDIDAALRTVAVIQKLDCFNRQFGGDVAARLERPLAAARQALDQPVAQH